VQISGEMITNVTNSFNYSLYSFVIF